jgi:hypothetical protein
MHGGNKGAASKRSGGMLPTLDGSSASVIARISPSTRLHVSRTTDSGDTFSYRKPTSNLFFIAGYPSVTPWSVTGGAVVGHPVALPASTEKEAAGA